MIHQSVHAVLEPLDFGVRFLLFLSLCPDDVVTDGDCQSPSVREGPRALTKVRMDPWGRYAFASSSIHMKYMHVWVNRIQEYKSGNPRSSIHPNHNSLTT